jgi:hypothetical protein
LEIRDGGKRDRAFVERRDRRRYPVASLFDMHLKYATVMELAQAREVMRRA